MSSQLTAGVARVVITPPVGIAMSGYAGREYSLGVHDDLTATALVLAERGADGEDGEGPATRVALLALDLLYLRGDRLVARIKARIQERTGIPPERVLLNCSHTHFGPETPGDDDDGMGPDVLAYAETLAHQLAGAVAVADAARRPVTLAAGRGSVKVGINRRERRPDGRIILGHNPEGTLDSEVLVWRFDAAGGPEVAPGAPVGWVRQAAEPVAVVVNYACHLTTLGSSTRRFSADLAGVMRGVVEQLVGGTALFVQGAAGNINPALMGPDWEYIRRQGRALGAEAARVALGAQPIAALPLRLARQRLDLPAMLPVSVEDGRARLAEAQQTLDRAREQATPEGQQRWARARLERARRGLAALEEGVPVPPVAADVAALRIGDAALATNPSELFCELGLSIKRASPLPWTGVAAYTDGAVGYIPTRAAYPEGGYEVDRACRLNPEAGEMVEETSIRLLRALAGSS